MASFARRAARITAILLLSLVAFDLASPTLCALDKATAAPTTQAAADGASHDAAPPEAPTHIDDCFCCSHCVHPGASIAPLGLTLVRGTLPAPLTDGDFSALGAPFHPPRS